MSQKRPPPPDHLIPVAWLQKVGVSEEELANWVAEGVVVKVQIHGGAEFVSFSSHQRPVKFGELSKLVETARDKCK
jgi:hypothetical protein